MFAGQLEPNRNRLKLIYFEPENQTCQSLADLSTVVYVCTLRVRTASVRCRFRKGIRAFSLLVELALSLPWYRCSFNITASRSMAAMRRREGGNCRLWNLRNA